MTDDAPPPPPMRSATDEEIAQTLAFGLRYEGRRRVRDADDAMAHITAARLVKLLRTSGYTVSKSASTAAPSTTAHMPDATSRSKP